MAAEVTQQTHELNNHEDYQRLLADIGELEHHQRFIVEIPTGSTCLETHLELSELQTLARDKGADLELVTDDPVRIELARIFRIPVGPSPETSGQKPGNPTRQHRLLTEPREDDEIHDAITVVGLDAAQRTPPSIAPVTEESPRFSTTKNPEYDLDSQPSFSFVITPPKKHYSDPNPLPVPLIPHRIPHPPPPAREKAHRSRISVILPIVLVGILIGTAAVLIGFLVPTATVRLTPVTTPVEAQISYGIAGTVDNLDAVLDPSILSTTLSWEGTIPTTGERFVPDASASGELSLTNPSTSEVIVPGDTILISADGIEYFTSYEVTVPAADPFGTQLFGSALVEIVSAVPGPEGNQEPMSIAGQLDSGVFFQNKAAISGGTMQRIATVSQSDIDSLENAAMSDFSTRSDSEASSLLSTEQVALDDSISIGTLSPVFSAEPGADAETISLSATAPLTVSVYSPTELHEMARSIVQERVSNFSSDKERLVLDSVWISEPEQTGSNETPTFNLSAGGTLETIINQAELDRLKTNLIGASQTEADELVRQINGVANSRVDYGPSWLPVMREPRLKSRIVIEIVN